MCSFEIQVELYFGPGVQNVPDEYLWTWVVILRSSRKRLVGRIIHGH